MQQQMETVGEKTRSSKKETERKETCNMAQNIIVWGKFFPMDVQQGLFYADALNEETQYGHDV
ncbi:MAG: hypothetical protein LC660_16650 [Desulfobacteraceae bacterium]|nr:hypothetical protein [Desulfobacteraceae bacterium]